MDSDDDYDENDDNDSGNVSSGDDDFAMDVVDIHASRDRQQETDEYPYEVLTTDEIVKHMSECIRKVNNVVQVSEKKIVPIIIMNFKFLWNLKNFKIRARPITHSTKYIHSILYFIYQGIKVGHIHIILKVRATVAQGIMT